VVVTIAVADELADKIGAVIVVAKIARAAVLLGVGYGVAHLLFYLFHYWTGLIDKEEYASCLEAGVYEGNYDRAYDKKYEKNDGIYGHLYYVRTDSKCPPILSVSPSPGKTKGHLWMLFNARGQEKIKGKRNDFALTKAAYEEIKSSFSPPRELDQYLVSRIVDEAEIKEEESKERQTEMLPLALRLQKTGQWGHTDYNQRREDMIECG
jgi:hypothetical protein